MTAPAVRVLIFFGTTATASTVFTLDDPVRGVLDNVSYTLGGDSGTDVSAYIVGATFNRGRTSQIFDDIDPATGTITLWNDTRLFDPFNTAGPYYGLIKPGLRVLMSTAGVTVFDGKIADWNHDYMPGFRNATATVVLEDALATLGRQDFLAWTSTAGQTAGPRITAILNRAEVAWSGGARNIGTGISTLQADNVSWGSNVLNYCQLVSKSDLGTFYASRDGLITFKDRQTNIGASVAAAFSDTGTGIEFDVVRTAFGSETYYTRVSVDRVGGIKQTANSSATVSAGFRTLSLAGLLQDSDSQALDMATYLAGIYSTGEARISELIIDMHEGKSVAQTSTVLGLDITDVVTVTWTPCSTGPQVVQSCIVQGISHVMSGTDYQVSLQLGVLQQRTAFTLDSSTLGVLDGVGVLSF